MKHTKRILAVLLTFALALTLALPATAAVNWDEFRITGQPQDLTITHGDSFTLRVEVDVPAGVEVEYQWFKTAVVGAPVLLTGATTTDLRLASGNFGYPLSSDNYFPYEYFCEITAYEKDGSGNEISSKKLTSYKARVTVEKAVKVKTFWEKVLSVTVMPFAAAFAMAGSAVLLSTFGGALALIVLPFAVLAYPFLVIYAFFGAVVELFK